MNTNKEGVAPLIGIATVATIAMLWVVAVHVGAWLTPTGAAYPRNPFTLTFALLQGRLPLPAATPALMVTGVVVLLALVAVIMALVARHQRLRRFDKIQYRLAATKDLAGLRDRERKKETKVLHPATYKQLPSGQRIGMAVTSDRAWILQGWRELAVFVFGPGRGKTSGVVARRVIEAPGANVMTSNKVDGVAEVIAGRKGRGTTYVFDPNRIYRREDTPDFIYNPLWDVHSKADAEELAAIFEDSTRKNSDRGGDAHFDTDGRNLLAYCFLAAALEEIPLATVYGWLAREEGNIPQEILRRYGHNGPATMIDGVDRSNDRTKNSVYVTARRMATALADDNLLAWTSAPGVRTFDPAAFHASTDTMVLLSKSGAGSGSALLTALVRGICRNAERAAERNGGRLPVPMVLELDECANTVQWPELPTVYSYYGSMGIILDTYFQSRAQGQNAFGKEGWQALWDAASIRVFGGGSGDDEFLRSLSNLIGEHDESVQSTSYTAGQRGSTSTSTRKVATLEVKDLAALPEWRAVVFPSKLRPVIVETRPWFRDKELTARITQGRTS